MGDNHYTEEHRHMTAFADPDDVPADPHGSTASTPSTPSTTDDHSLTTQAPQPDERSPQAIEPITGPEASGFEPRWLATTTGGVLVYYCPVCAGLVFPSSDDMIQHTAFHVGLVNM